MAAVAVSFPAAASAAKENPEFWATWGDGKAELDGYTLTQSRYGEPRDGKAVMIFVTEDHSVKEQVKIEGDPSKVPAKEKYSVMKLNVVRHFQTGIYSYHVLGSVFCRVDDHFQPSKISVSVQEWCGHVYHQLVIDRRRVVETLHSYFGGEGDQTRVHRFRDPILFADTIPLLVRELQGPWLAPGQTQEFSGGPTLLSLRLSHKPFEWKTIKITKSAKRILMGSVLGKIAVTRWTIETADQGTLTYWVEVDW
ncbi:MAG: hypothetical protein EPO02_14025, partial [Nitrospirae bacterium]